MSQTVALRVPQELYEALRAHAAKRGQTPDALAVEWLAETIQQAGAFQADPLLSLLGTIQSHVTDVAEHHDDYIGQSVSQELHGDE